MALISLVHLRRLRLAWCSLYSKEVLIGRSHGEAWNKVKKKRRERRERRERKKEIGANASLEVNRTFFGEGGWDQGGKSSCSFILDRVNFGRISKIFVSVQFVINESKKGLIKLQKSWHDLEVYIPRGLERKGILNGEDKKKRKEKNQKTYLLSKRIGYNPCHGLPSNFSLVIDSLNWKKDLSQGMDTDAVVVKFVYKPLAAIGSW